MILVTGAAGFIGSVIAARLIEGGRTVAICDRFEAAAKWRNIAKHPVCDIVAPDRVLDWVEAHGRDLVAIVHMGAISATTETDVDLIVETNFRLSRDLWNLSRKHGIRFLYASSAATYGAGEHGFRDDQSLEHLAKLRPLNAYGWSKALFDIAAIRMAEKKEAPPQWAGLKFFNVYGPNEYHKGGQRSVVHQIFEQLRDTGRARLFQSHHPDYGDGGQLRDFVWVEDCAAMVEWLLDKPDISGLFNCGTGKARSFLDLANAVFAAMGRAPEIDFVPTPEAIRRHYQYFTEADMAKARQAGFAHNPVSLEEGVRRYVVDYLMTEDPYR